MGKASKGRGRRSTSKERKARAGKSSQGLPAPYASQPTQGLWSTTLNNLYSDQLGFNAIPPTYGEESGRFSTPEARRIASSDSPFRTPSSSYHPSSSPPNTDSPFSSSPPPAPLLAPRDRRSNPGRFDPYPRRRSSTPPPPQSSSLPPFLTWGVELECLVATRHPLRANDPDPSDNRPIDFPVIERTGVDATQTNVFYAVAYALAEEGISTTFRAGMSRKVVNIAGKSPRTRGGFKRSSHPWSLVEDVSCDAKGGRYRGADVELVSPIFKGGSADAYDEVETVCRVMNERFRSETNVTTGLHIHVGCGIKRKFAVAQLKNLFALLWTFEPVIMPAIHPKRRTEGENGDWAQSMRWYLRPRFNDGGYSEFLEAGPQGGKLAGMDMRDVVELIRQQGAGTVARLHNAWFDTDNIHLGSMLNPESLEGASAEFKNILSKTLFPGQLSKETQYDVLKWLLHDDRFSAITRMEVNGRSTDTNPEGLIGRHIRYGKHSAYNFINVAAAKGTVEFRQHEGNLDAQRITNWSNVCQGLVDFALRGTCDAPEGVQSNANADPYMQFRQNMKPDFADFVLGEMEYQSKNGGKTKTTFGELMDAIGCPEQKVYYEQVWGPQLAVINKMPIVTRQQYLDPGSGSDDGVDERWEILPSLRGMDVLEI